MSGGSLDYLYLHLGTVNDLRGQLQNLAKGAAELRAIGHPEAAQLLENEHTRIWNFVEARPPSPQLIAAAMAVEWWLSGDWGPETVNKHLQEPQP